MINGSGKETHKDISKRAENIKKEALAGMGDVLEDSKEKMYEVSERISETAQDTRMEAERRIKSKPFQYIAGATLGGAVLGFLLGRKR